MSQLGDSPGYHMVNADWRERPVVSTWCFRRTLQFRLAASRPEDTPPFKSPDGSRDDL